MSKILNVCLVGAGYAAMLHARSYQRLYGVDINLTALCNNDITRAQAFANTYHIKCVRESFEEMLSDPHIDIVDICTSPFLHKAMIEKAFFANKHVICEKPLTGYFGQAGDLKPIGLHVSKEVMYQNVCENIMALKEIIQKANSRFFYAENFLYAPMVVKAGELIEAKKSKVLYSQGELYIPGSTSSVAGQWSKTGGGALIRNGCHIISALLSLKQREAVARGETISVQSVSCDTGVSTGVLSEAEKRFISARPEDVEDFANLTITFSDNTKAVVLVSDAVLGGNVNSIRLFSNNAVYKCNLTPSGILDAYFVNEEGPDDIELNGRLPSGFGWERVDISDETLRGYNNQLQDFIECIVTGRPSISDFEIAANTIKIIYLAYWSAEKGCRIDMR
jgi:predicted dehydrogenase